MKKQDPFAPFLLQIIILICQLINCGLNLRIFVHLLDIISSKFTNNHSNPRISHSIKKLSRRKQHVYNRARLSRHPDDWRLYHQLNKECQHECRKAYDSYVLSLVDCNNNVSKECGHTLKIKR